MWQVSGRSDITDFEEVVRLDKEYITNWNIGLDIKILFNGVNRPVIRKPELIKKKFRLEKDDYILFLGRLVPGVYESEVAEKVKNTFEEYRETQDYKTSKE